MIIQDEQIFKDCYDGLDRYYELFTRGKTRDELIEKAFITEVNRYGVDIRTYELRNADDVVLDHAIKFIDAELDKEAFLQEAAEQQYKEYRKHIEADLHKIKEDLE